MMTKQLLFLILLLSFFNSSWGQKNITNTLTPEHQNIKGTKVSIIPPSNFLPTTRFLGFGDEESGASIMCADIPGPFSETSKAFTKEVFLTQGIEIEEIESFTINQVPAILGKGTQKVYGDVYTKYILCLGTEKETIMLVCLCSEEMTDIAADIKASLLTCIYEPNKQINPFDNVDFQVDISKSNLLFASGMSKSLIFTRDGLIPTKLADKTALMFSKSMALKLIPDRQLFCVERLKQLPIELDKIEINKEVTIDNLPGYEIIASSKSKKTGEPEKVIQVILFDEELYYIFYGTTNQEFDKNIDELKKVMLTFRRK